MASSPPRVKKEHYVPQLYLQEWATGETLHVFDKTSGRQFSQNIRDTCSERGFYDDAQLDALCGKSQSLEKFFHGFENAGAKVIRETLDSIRAGSFSVLPECALVDLGIFPGIQQLRTKRVRAHVGALMEAISSSSSPTFDAPSRSFWLKNPGWRWRLMNERDSEPSFTSSRMRKRESACLLSSSIATGGF
jgi:hypothetical protein